MANMTLGRYGRFFATIIYALLMYSLLAAYISGGSDLFSALLIKAHLHLPSEASAVLFTLVLGAVVYRDIQVVDWINRLLMFIKMGLYVWLVVAISPHVERSYLLFANTPAITPATLVIVTSFGYSVIIPSLCRYLERNVQALRATLLFGSFGALLCYLLWDFAVQGTLAPEKLLHIALHSHATSQLTEALNNVLHSTVVRDLSHMFTSICVTTSFLGVALCLSDFVTDGIKAGRTGYARVKVMMLTFLPPLLVACFIPSFFILGLHYAGIFCVSLLILFPCLMVWSGRYIKKIDSIYTVFGGKSLLALSIVASFLVLCYGVYQTI
eukprot:TRINITY_DN49386_c0_g1_i1.p1 TRINITY_DN49386_c0_g1~~TRINITY_DN49386_c0_g1_i1.p1  ORF type:complete len:338 (+),score=-76.87 TRINITY_DN49386_c0_g1_i1:38-1015(+)